MLIIKPDFLIIRHSKTPIHPGGVFKATPVVSISTISGIDWLILQLMGRARGSSQIFPRTGTRINRTRITQLSPGS